MSVKLQAGWLDHFSYENSIEILVSLALDHAEDSGPFKEALVDMLRRRDWSALLDYRIWYVPGMDPGHLVNARQALGFFQKFEPLKLGKTSKTLEAFHRFGKAELGCQRVNDRFCEYRLGTPREYPWDAILESARRKIARILGGAPSLEELKFQFGPGAQTNVKKKDACFRVKLGVPLECSSELAPYVKILLAEMPLLSRHHAHSETDDVYRVAVNVVPGRLQFVPKDAKKYRTITIEPGLNVLFQQGLGRAIRKRLNKAGVDLSDQTKNQRLAKAGSLSDKLATIDFSQASDTISTQLVAFLLPEDWYTLLALARTSEVEYEGLLIHLEKFSTMGNSFTFELESLIFYSLAWACLEHLQLPKTDLSIFGDDLIIPSDAMSLVECAFAFCGFVVNSDKSYWRGPFRESCGADYYSGLDIRPFYQKTLVSGETLFTLHNHYMRTGEVKRAEALREKWIHPDLYLFGPDGYGDGHLIGSWEGVKRRIVVLEVDSSGRKTKKKFPHTYLGWEGSYFRSWSHMPSENSVAHHGDQLLPSYSIYSRDPVETQEPEQSPISSQGGWADPRYFTVPGSSGYGVVFIYTLATSIFQRRR